MGSRRGKRRGETYHQALARAEEEVERWSRRVCSAAARLADARARVRRYMVAVTRPPAPRDDEVAKGAREAVERELVERGESLEPSAKCPREPRLRRVRGAKATSEQPERSW